MGNVELESEEEEEEPQPTTLAGRGRVDTLRTANLILTIIRGAEVPDRGLDHYPTL